MPGPTEKLSLSAVLHHRDTNECRVARGFGIQNRYWRVFGAPDRIGGVPLRGVRV